MFLFCFCFVSVLFLFCFCVVSDSFLFVFMFMCMCFVSLSASLLCFIGIKRASNGYHILLYWISPWQLGFTVRIPIVTYSSQAKWPTSQCRGSCGFKATHWELGLQPILYFTERSTGIDTRDGVFSSCATSFFFDLFQFMFLCMCLLFCFRSILCFTLYGLCFMIMYLCL